ncbi:phosphoadenosine phosphosulfate reductase, partial [Limosilactobacillus fermentum]
MSGKRYLKKTVCDAAKERIKRTFDEFDNVLVAFSGGKDSGVMLNMAYDYAKENNL